MNVVKLAVEGMVSKINKRLEYMPPGDKKEKFKQLVAEFGPIFQRALETGDCSKLIQLQQRARDIENEKV